MNQALLSNAQFQALCKIAHAKWGLDIQPGKFELVNGRMRTYLKKNGGTTQEVIDSLECGGDGDLELKVFDVLSTNLTSFYRESDHFDCLAREIIEPAREAGTTKRLRFWSAACSKGCEPYTMGMVLKDTLPDLANWDVKILATDLARSVVSEARRGVYKSSMVEDLPQDVVDRHFTEGKGKSSGFYRVDPMIRKMVTFGIANLTGEWQHRGPFDAIFCRNVMIYFDESTRTKLVNRMRTLIRPGGLLILGSSEGLSETPDSLVRVQPAVYRAA